MVSLRRLPITLLELMIVMAILALVAGIVAVSINKALVDQRFRTEVSMIVDELRLAQDLMLILGADVHVKFAEEGSKGIKYWIELETSLPDHINREILRKHHKLKTIRGVSFADELNKNSAQGQLDIRFQSKGMVMSQGILKLATSGESNLPMAALKNYICLPGFPKPISSSDSEEFATSGMATDAEFDEKITRDTFFKLPEKLKYAEETPQEEIKTPKSEKKEGFQRKPPLKENPQ